MSAPPSELAGLIIEDEQGMELMAAMVAAKSQLLLVAIALKTRGIDIQRDLAAVVLKAVEPGQGELALHRADIGGGRGVLQTGQGRLGGERGIARSEATGRLKAGVIAQRVGVVLIGVAERDLEDALEELLGSGVHNGVGVALIGEHPGEVRAEAEAVSGLA